MGEVRSAGRLNGYEHHEHRRRGRKFRGFSRALGFGAMPTDPIRRRSTGWGHVRLSMTQLMLAVLLVSAGTANAQTEEERYEVETERYSGTMTVGVDGDVNGFRGGHATTSIGSLSGSGSFSIVFNQQTRTFFTRELTVDDTADEVEVLISPNILRDQLQALRVYIGEHAYSLENATRSTETFTINGTPQNGFRYTWSSTDLPDLSDGDSVAVRVVTVTTQRRTVTTVWAAEMTVGSSPSNDKGYNVATSGHYGSMSTNAFTLDGDGYEVWTLKYSPLDLELYINPGARSTFEDATMRLYVGEESYEFGDARFRIGQTFIQGQTRDYNLLEWRLDSADIPALTNGQKVQVRIAWVGTDLPTYEFEVWSANMTVGTFRNTSLNINYAGYSNAAWDSGGRTGSLSDNNFMLGSQTYHIRQFQTLSGSGVPSSYLTLNITPRAQAVFDNAPMTLQVGNISYPFDDLVHHNGSFSTHRWSSLRWFEDFPTLTNGDSVRVRIIRGTESVPENPMEPDEIPTAGIPDEPTPDQTALVSGTMTVGVSTVRRYETRGYSTRGSGTDPNLGSLSSTAFRYGGQAYRITSLHAYRDDHRPIGGVVHTGLLLSFDRLMPGYAHQGLHARGSGADNRALRLELGGTVYDFASGVPQWDCGVGGSNCRFQQIRWKNRAPPLTQGQRVSVRLVARDTGFEGTPRAASGETTLLSGNMVAGRFTTSWTRYLGYIPQLSIGSLTGGRRFQIGELSLILKRLNVQRNNRYRHGRLYLELIADPEGGNAIAFENAGFVLRMGTQSFSAQDADYSTVLYDDHPELVRENTLIRWNGTSTNPIPTLPVGSVTKVLMTVSETSGQEQEPDTEPVTPFTAAFTDVPPGHDGKTTITIGLEFSEEPVAFNATVLEGDREGNGSVLDLENAVVRSAVRKVSGENRRWTITLEPLGFDEVSFGLLPATDCNAANAICAPGTPRNRPLAYGTFQLLWGPPGISVVDADVVEGDGTTLDFTVAMRPPAGENVTVDYTTSDDTATAAADYTAASGTLTFAPGDVEKTVSVAVLDDTTGNEGTETLTLTLSDVSGGNAYLADATATGSIADDDVTSSGVVRDDGDNDDPPTTTKGQRVLSVTDASADEGGTASFEIELDAVSETPVSVDYATSDGTATAGADYTAASGTLAFKAGETAKTVDVAVLDDAEAEDEETFLLTLSKPSGATLANATATGTIAANDAPNPPVAVAFEEVPAGHNGGRFWVRVTMGEEIEGLGHAWVRDTLVTVTGATVERAKRTDPPSNIGWRLEVAPVDAGTDVVLTVAATVLPGGKAVEAGAVATVTGQSLSVADVAAAEGGTASFAVTLDRGALRTVTVDYATADGTAVAGSDYTAAAGTLTFAPGTSRATVAVAVLDDTTSEFEETFSLTLSNPSGAGLDDTTATATINDDDAPTVRLREVPTEHDGNSTFTVELAFSEEIADIGYAWVRDSLVTVTNGTVEKARRADPPSNLEWELDIEPDGSVDVTLAVADGLTLPDGRNLIGGDTVTVQGPAPRTASSRRATVTLTWGSPRDEFGTSLGSDWIVSVNGVPRPVAAAEIERSRATLMLSAPVAPGDAVAVGYVGSAMHPLADATGQVRSAPWYDLPVENTTGVSGLRLGAASIRYAPHADPNLAALDSAVVLNASGAGLTDVQAFTRLTALERLDLSNNHVVDLSPLAQLTSLKWLDLSGNRVVDLSPLARLTSLERLDLSGNTVEDLSPLAQLTLLKRLDLSDNQVTDLWPLVRLNHLERLDLSRNRVADASSLAELNTLKVLLLDRNAVTDVSPFAQLASLENLGLAHNRVTKATALQELTLLRRLDLDGNPVRDPSPLGDATGVAGAAR